LTQIAEGKGPEAGVAKRMRGHVAVASAKEAYRIYKELFRGPRFGKLAEKGAHPQRLLWASTSTKNPDYSDVKYVEALIGPETVNTIPRETLNAFRDHGIPSPRIEESPEESRRVLETLDRLGIDMERVSQRLEEEGVEKFNAPYDSLMKTLAEKVPQAGSTSIASAASKSAELDFCIKAPEWAEHQRLEDTDLACDDGRRGNI